MFQVFKYTVSKYSLKNIPVGHFFLLYHNFLQIFFKNCDVGHFLGGVTNEFSFVNISQKFYSKNVQVHNPSTGFMCQTAVRVIGT